MVEVTIMSVVVDALRTIVSYFLKVLSLVPPRPAGEWKIFEIEGNPAYEDSPRIIGL